ncbi:hypothetical protein K9N68_16270 [Kovacikia minuta CCNUW1]|uniref:hypothetical protein n=1 Tax=Kovacikia minuta TaxID=2931930 RepID=UPI001CC8EDC3|nr:hypothetical protein [Kovacikia minuta]UBF29246.1 hypothetical protein K9N68_16270 [Kovacikia minuta CCNUW1]
MPKGNSNKSTGALAAIAIVASGFVISGPAQAEPVQQTIAQASLCRAANRSTPVFEADSTISSALLLLRPNQQVTLTDIPPAGSQFARITVPVSGYVQTAVLKACGGPPPPPQTACRYLKQPPLVKVRREPRIVDSPSNVIGQVYQGERVSVLLNPDGSVKSAQADGFNWVAIDPTRAPLFLPPGTAWLFNSVVGSSESNLGYCY